MKKVPLLLLLVLLLSTTAVAQNPAGSSKTMEERMAAFELQVLRQEMISEKAPYFTAVDLNGKIVTLASLRGEIVVLDFWATWCGPCVASFPGMQRAMALYRQDKNVVFLFVNTWEQGTDKKKQVLAFLARQKYTLPVLLDTQDKMSNAFKVTGVPTTFILDGNGTIRYMLEGDAVNADGVPTGLLKRIELVKKETQAASKARVSSN